MNNLFINDFIIHSRYLSMTAVRSSGAGGQNVNKVSSKVELRFDYLKFINDTHSFDADCIERLLKLVKLDTNNNILIVSQATRDQHKNLEDARNKLKDFIIQALIVPTPRIDTEPTLSSQNKRLNSKQKHSNKKQNRQWKDE